MGSRATRSTLTREDWVHVAQRTLVKGGVDAVRVDVLAKELNITRGSFYHHFKNRDELLDAILSEWRMRATENVIGHLRDAHIPPEEQLRELMELPLRGDSAHEAASIEVGIRAWARRDQRARTAIDEVDRHRLSFIAGLLIQMDIVGAEADDRAHLIYGYQLSLSLVSVGASIAERKARAKRMAAIVLPQA